MSDCMAPEEVQQHTELRKFSADALSEVRGN